MQFKESEMRSFKNKEQTKTREIIIVSFKNRLENCQANNKDKSKTPSLASKLEKCNDFRNKSKLCICFAQSHFLVVSFLSYETDH